MSKSKTRTSKTPKQLPPAFAGIVPVNTPAFKSLATADEQARLLIARACGLARIKLDVETDEHLTQLVDAGVEAVMGEYYMGGALGAMFEDGEHDDVFWDVIQHVRNVKHSAFRLGLAVGARIGGAR